MAKRPVVITQSEIARALKGVMAGGFQPSKIEIEGGKMVIYASGMEGGEVISALDEWRLKNGEG